MASANSNEVVEMNINRDLQPIINQHLLTQQQADTIVKFISTDYNVRRAHRICPISQIAAYTNLILLLEFLVNNSPISIVDQHVSDLFHTLVLGLCWHFEGPWFNKLLEFSHEIKSIPDLLSEENLEARKRHLTTVSDRSNLKRKGKFNEASKARKAFDDRDDGRVEASKRSEQAVGESFRDSGNNEDGFENKVNDIDPELVRVCAELKTVREARAKIASLEFDIFSPTIVRDKVVTSGVKVKEETS